MRLSLFWKLMAAFALVLVVGVGGVTFVARQTTTSEFRQYMFGGGSSLDQVVAQLADYYAQNGSWDGVLALVSGNGMGGGMMRGGMGGRLILADAHGNIVADSSGTAGGQMSSGQLARGVPIVVKGQRVGTLFASGGMTGGMMGAAEQTFLDRVNRAVLLTGLAAGVVALLLGFIIFRSITAPLSRLTYAAHAVAAGDLAQRVHIHSGDEVADVGAAFNSMAENLQRSEQLRREMTADIAHELRTPLSVIRGNLEAVLDGVYPADVEHIQPALDQAQLLARLVEDLRTLALAEAGQLSLDRQPTDTVELVKRVVASFEPSATGKRVALSVDSPPSLPRTQADGQRIAQVLTNLLGNALRYTPENGRVDVQLRAEAKSVVVAVTDSGPGISADDLPHIFDRFYRADKSRSREGGGSGLGLAIARGIIAAHGGRIWAESKTGQGTTLAFTLPVG
jgi:signal transduction histidine kinase